MELQKTNNNNRQITSAGEHLRQELKKTWRLIEVRKETMFKDQDGNIKFKEVTELVEHPNKRMNADVSKETWQELWSIITDDDAAQVVKTIQAGTFNAIKALEVFKTTPHVIIDPKIMPTTWEDAQSLKWPTFTSISKYKGETKAHDLIYMMLFSFSRKFGKRNDLTEEQISEISTEILNQYRGLMVSEFKMILASLLRASQKRFNLDYSGIMSAMAEHYDDKLSDAAKRSLQQHQRETGIEKETRFLGISDRPDFDAKEIKAIINQEVNASATKSAAKDLLS